MLLHDIVFMALHIVYLHFFLKQYVNAAITLTQGLSSDLSNPAQNDALIKGKMAVIKLI